MNKLSLWLKAHFITLMLVFTAAGFLIILAELLLERHWDSVQLVAPVSAVLGFGLALLGGVAALASSGKSDVRRA